MKKKFFLLSPVQDKIKDPAWEWSLETDHLVVCATSQEEARDCAFRDFEMFVREELRQLTPPWLDQNFVSVFEADELSNFIPDTNASNANNFLIGVIAVGVHDTVIEKYNSQ